MVAAPDVTVDFNGHVVDGAGSGNGVRAKKMPAAVSPSWAARSVEFHDGVFTESAYAQLRAMRILDNAAYGVEAYGAGASVEDSVVAGNRTGTWEASPVRNSTFRRNSGGAITLSEGVGTITDNIVRRNGAGILAGEGDGTIARNIVTDNPHGGISWHFSGEGAIRDNFIARNGNGISIETFARPSVIEGNVLLHNRSDGILGRWTDGFGSVIRNNWIRGNEGSGIVVTGHDPCPQVQDNHLDHNDEDGVLMTGLSAEGSDCDEGVPIIGNTATRNAGDGFHVVDNSGAVLLEDNRADRNGDDGIDIDPRAAVFHCTGVVPVRWPRRILGCARSRGVARRAEPLCLAG